MWDFLVFYNISSVSVSVFNLCLSCKRVEICHKNIHLFFFLYCMVTDVFMWPSVCGGESVWLSPYFSFLSLCSFVNPATTTCVISSACCLNWLSGDPAVLLLLIYSFCLWDSQLSTGAATIVVWVLARLHQRMIQVPWNCVLTVTVACVTVVLAGGEKMTAFI